MDGSHHAGAHVVTGGLGSELGDTLPCRTTKLTEQLAAMALMPPLAQCLSGETDRLISSGTSSDRPRPHTATPEARPQAGK